MCGVHAVDVGWLGSEGIRVNLSLHECLDLGARGAVVLCFGVSVFQYFGIVGRGGCRAKHGGVNTDF